MKPRARRLTMDTPELNLVPLLDMVSLLIQLLLINAQFGVFAEIGAALGRPSPTTGEGLQLQVRISPQSGFSVSWLTADGRQSQELPCLGTCEDVARYDAGGLRSLTRELALDFPEEQQVQLRLATDTPFEVVALVMDAMRGDGDAFPDVVMGGP